MAEPAWDYVLAASHARRLDPELIMSALKRTILGGEDRYSERELCRLAGVDPDLARKLWRAMGFADIDPDTKAYTESDLEALQQGRAALQAREEDVVVQHTRVISSLLARVADVLGASMVEDIGRYRNAGLSDDEVAAAAVAQATILDVTSLMEYLFRRQLVTAVARQLTSGEEVPGPEEAPCAVIFADLVGFTSLSQQLDDAELATLVTRFQSEAHELVSANGGRVVKTLGDEVMVIVDDVTAGAEIALRFVEVFAEDELVPQARVGMAWGPVLALQGDYYGPTVNLASRLVSMARPGTVLASPDAHSVLEEAAVGRWSRLRPHRVKGIGWTTAWVLRREQAQAGDGERRPWWKPLLAPAAADREVGDGEVGDGDVAADGAAEGPAEGTGDEPEEGGGRNASQLRGGVPL